MDKFFQTPAKYAGLPIRGLLFLLCLANVAGAQVRVDFRGETDPIPEKSIRITDTARVEKELQKLRQNLFARGYLEAGVDSVVKGKNPPWQAYWHTGKQYRWVALKWGNVPTEIFSQARASTHKFSDKPFSPVQFSGLTARILTYYENHGYPFVRLELDKPQIEGNGIQGTLHIDQGPLVKFDSLVVKGDVKVNRSFLKRYLELKPGGLFSQKKLERISSRVDEIGFLRKIRESETLFTDSAYSVYLYLKEKSASQFDGILGLLPDPNSDKLLITGDLNLKLVNSLQHGERLALNWRKLQSNTQELNASFSYPYLFNSPLGVDLTLKLYRRDTIFSQSTLRAGLNYSLGGLNRFGAWFESFRGNSLNPAQIALGRQRDLRTSLYGVEYHSTKLDYRFNPRKGYELNVEGATGEKTVVSDTTNSNGETKNIETSQPQYRVNWRARYFFPVGTRFTLMAATIGGWKQSKSLYRTEAYRIGGLRDLRGFEDQSIYATTYAIGRAEFRFLLERNSNLFVFFDQGYYSDETLTPNIEDTPIGFGAGANFETGVGIFSLSYALGRQFNNPIEFRAAKIHFGYTSLF